MKIRFIILLCLLLHFNQLQGQTLSSGDNKRINFNLLTNLESIGIGVDYQYRMIRKPIFHRVNFNWGRLGKINKTLTTQGNIFLLGYGLGYNFIKNILILPIELNASLGPTIGYETKNIDAVLIQESEEKFIYGTQLNLWLTYKISSRLGIGVNYYFAFLFNSIYNSKGYNSFGLGVNLVI